MIMTDDAPNPLTTAGYLANEGFVFPGQTFKPAATGSRKRVHRITPKPFGPVDPDAPAPTPERVAPVSKPITRGAVTAIGFYTRGADVVRVKISRSSGKPYGLLLNADTGEWVYTPGILKTLSSDDVLSYEKAATYGKRTGRCIICGLTLTVQASIDAGIGPVCGKRLPRASTPPAKTMVDVVTDDSMKMAAVAHETAQERGAYMAKMATDRPYNAPGKIDHSRCGHPRTPKARAICRAERNG